MGRKAKESKNGEPVKTAEERIQERRDRFLRLAPRRVQRAVKALDGVARLANRQSYQYTPEEAAKIRAALDAACEGALRELSGEAKQPKLFTL